MEFKYRAVVVDDRPTTTQTPYPTPSHSSLPVSTFFPEPPFLGGFSGTGTIPIPNTSRVSVNNAVFAREALRREVEKAQIRREIIAREVARRLELEDEVRRELALERGHLWGIATPHHGFSFQETLSMPLNHPRITPFESVNVNHVPLPKPPPLLQLAMAEREPSPVINKDRVIILDKPNPDVDAAKRKAITPPVVDGREVPPFGLKKKPREEWSCALCRVSATNKKGLNIHLQGRKHRAKEAALRQQKVGRSNRALVSSTKSKSAVKSVEAISATSGLEDTKEDRDSLQAEVHGGDECHTVDDKGIADSKIEEQLVQNSHNTGLTNGATTKAALKRFWCGICKVGAFSQNVMESHKKGKRHLKLMKKLNPKCDGSQLTSSVSQEEEMCSDKVYPVAESSGDRMV